MADTQQNETKQRLNRLRKEVVEESGSRISVKLELLKDETDKVRKRPKINGFAPSETQELPQVS